MRFSTFFPRTRVFISLGFGILFTVITVMAAEMVGRQSLAVLLLGPGDLLAGDDLHSISGFFLFWGATPHFTRWWLLRYSHSRAEEESRRLSSVPEGILQLLNLFELCPSLKFKTAHKYAEPQVSARMLIQSPPLRRASSPVLQTAPQYRSKNSRIVLR